MTGPRGGAEGPAPASERPGHAVERTRLAWRRTTLAMSVVTLLAARLALSHGTAGAALSAVVLAEWVAVTVVTYPRVVGRRPPGGGRAFPLLAVATVGYAGLGASLVLLTLR